MNARAYLEQLETIDYKIINKLDRIKELKGNASGTSGASDGERVQSSGDKQRMAVTVASYVDLEREVECLEAEKRAIEKTIEKLNGNQYDFLYKRYFLGMSAKRIARTKGMSESWGTTMHQRALQSLQKILDAEGL